MQMIRIGRDKHKELQPWFYKTLHYIAVELKYNHVPHTSEIVVSQLQPSDWDLSTGPSTASLTPQQVVQSQIFLDSKAQWLHVKKKKTQCNTNKSQN